MLLATGSGRKASPVNEQSTMVVETVEKQPGQKSLARFKGDAGRVVVRGPGLKKAVPGRLQSFTVDVKDAGKDMCSFNRITNRLLFCLRVKRCLRSFLVS